MFTTIKPRKSKGKASTADQGQAKRDREAQRSRTQSAAAREIGAIPPPADQERRDGCELDLRGFCETYLSAIFALAFSEDHLRAIRKIERAALEGGLFAYAMPRGQGKTVIAQAGATWAMLYGHRRFVTLISSTETAAAGILKNIKAALQFNDLLAADFPEVCLPIRALENDARRCAGQLCNGKKTGIVWTNDKLVLPTVDGSGSAGAVVTVCGLTGRIRGQNHTLATGEIIRPELVIPDDVQTFESAHSDAQCAQREQILNADVLGLAGPGKKIAAFMPCTVIRSGDLADRFLNRETHPEWQGERTKLLVCFPTNTALWDQYASLRADSLRDDGDGSTATSFYAANRIEMDAGAVAAWPERKNPDELSAIQHAINLKLRDPDAFFAEYQNEPRIKELGAKTLRADDVLKKLNGLQRGHLPLEAQRVTGFIDVHDNALFWCVAGWSPEDFAGWVTDYGTYPDQGRRHFTLRDADRTLQRACPGAGKEGAIRAGLERLTSELFSRVWIREDGAELSIDRLLIDVGYMPEVVFNFIRASTRAGMIMGSRGVGIGAASRPMSEYRKQPGEQLGNNWIIPRPAHRELRTVRFDSNFWKSFVHDRLALTAGDKGTLSLWGTKPDEHRLFSEHITAEFATETEGRGRKLREWRPRPTGPDNHWLDTVVGCAVAASMSRCGRSAPVKTATRRRAPRVTYFED
jgi:hypothetical protein